MYLEIAKIVVLIGGIAALSPYGPRVASAAVGIAFGATAIAGVALVLREGPSPRRLLAGFFQPLAACGVMSAAAWGVHDMLIRIGLDQPAVLLIAMIVIGACVYVAAALVLCRGTARDLLDLLKKALRRQSAE
jgi:hypothetical protein